MCLSQKLKPISNKSDVTGLKCSTRWIVFIDDNLLKIVLANDAKSFFSISSFNFHWNMFCSQSLSNRHSADWENSRLAPWLLAWANICSDAIIILVLRQIKQLLQASLCLLPIVFYLVHSRRRLFESYFLLCGRDDGLVVSILDFYSDNLSSILAANYIVLKRRK